MISFVSASKFLLILCHQTPILIFAIKVQMRSSSLFPFYEWFESIFLFLIYLSIYLTFYPSIHPSIFGFCPRGYLIFVRFRIDSWKRQRKFDSIVKHHLLVLNRQRSNLYSIQLQFLRSSKSVEASTRQPESHHRVVFLQPTPSLEGVLDSRRIYVYFQFF